MGYNARGLELNTAIMMFVSSVRFCKKVREVGVLVKPPFRYPNRYSNGNNKISMSD